MGPDALGFGRVSVPARCTADRTAPRLKTKRQK